MAARNIAVFLDGTWNNPDNQTNVFTLFELTAGIDARHLCHDDAAVANTGQIKYYDEGVGTGLMRLVSGATGIGLSRNLRQAYQFLCRHYRPDDRIFLFGFSRGAYTARSLAGMMDAIGLLPREALSESTLRAAVKAYKSGNAAYHAKRIERRSRQREASGRRAGKSAARDKAAIERLGRDMDAIKAGRRSAHERFRRQWRTRGDVAIHFLGVWDTVGALGLPEFGFSFIQRRNYHAMHDTEMSRCVRHAYHALAIDEHRRVFRHSPWTRRFPENLEVEQQWFVGAHSDVGGGVRHNQLNNIALFWMQSHAVDKGLSLIRCVEWDDDWLLAPVSDSYERFAFGLYKWLSRKRHYRQMNLCRQAAAREPHGVEQDNVCERVHPSVRRYLETHLDYQPPNLPQTFNPSE